MEAIVCLHTNNQHVLKLLNVHVLAANAKHPIQTEYEQFAATLVELLEGTLVEEVVGFVINSDGLMQFEVIDGKVVIVCDKISLITTNNRTDLFGSDLNELADRVEMINERIIESPRNGALFEFEAKVCFINK